MSTIRGGVEQSRERLVALVLLLQRAWQYGALTQEEILRELLGYDAAKRAALTAAGAFG